MLVNVQFFVEHRNFSHRNMNSFRQLESGWIKISSLQYTTASLKNDSNISKILEGLLFFRVNYPPSH